MVEVVKKLVTEQTLSNMICLPCQQAKAALNKVNNVVNGYVNLIVKDSDVEALAKQRMAICNTCTYRVPLVKVAGVQYYNCSKCHCPLDAATRSTGYSCPMGKW